VVVIDQSDVCLQRLLSYPWASKPEGNQSSKMPQLTPPRFTPMVTLWSRVN